MARRTVWRRGCAKEGRTPCALRARCCKPVQVVLVGISPGRKLLSAQKRFHRGDLLRSRRSEVGTGPRIVARQCPRKVLRYGAADEGCEVRKVSTQSERAG